LVLNMLCGVAIAAPQIAIQKSEEIFDLFCLANASGYSFENKDHYSDARTMTQTYLSDSNDDCKNELNDFKTLTKDDIYYSKLMNQLFADSGSLAVKTKFNVLRRKYKKCANLGVLEKKLSSEYEKEIRYYKKNIPLIVSFVKKQLNLSSSLWPDKIVVIPNLLDAHYRGYNIQNNNNVFIIVGPGRDRNNLITIVHELIHVLFNNDVKISQPCPLLYQKFEAIKKTYPIVASGYADLGVYLRENMAIGFEVYLAKKYFGIAEGKLFTNYRKQRFIFALPFLRYLEKQDDGISDVHKMVQLYWNDICSGSDGLLH